MVFHCGWLLPYAGKFNNHTSRWFWSCRGLCGTCVMACGHAFQTAGCSPCSRLVQTGLGMFLLVNSYMQRDSWLRVVTSCVVKDCAVRRASMCILQLVHHPVAAALRLRVLYIYDMHAVAMGADACNAWASRSGGSSAYARQPVCVSSGLHSDIGHRCACRGVVAHVAGTPSRLLNPLWAILCTGVARLGSTVLQFWHVCAAHTRSCSALSANGFVASYAPLAL
jgi:hypothetical protein